MGQLKQIRPEDHQDLDLQNRVSLYLERQHFPSFKKLSIEAESGRVTIMGTVCSFYERQVAVNSCQQVAGVLKLIDQIVVDELFQKQSEPSSRSTA